MLFDSFLCHRCISKKFILLDTCKVENIRLLFCIVSYKQFLFVIIFELFKKAHIFDFFELIKKKEKSSNPIHGVI
jgi:hypothetical protein